MGTMFQKVSCGLLVAYIGKAVLGLCSGKKHDLRYPGACSCKEICNCGNVMKQTGQQYAKHFHKFEIKITSSFERNEA